MARSSSIAQFALAALAAFACACGSNDAGGGSPKSASRMAGAPANAKVGREVGNLAPDFEAKDVEGKSFKLSDYRGKVVLIDFWGFW